MKQRILHLSTLERKRACIQQVNLFRELFGESITVTEKKAVSVADRFTWNWVANQILSQKALVYYYKTIHTASDEYKRTKGLSWVEYNKDIEYWKTQAKTFANLYINDKP